MQSHRKVQLSGSPSRPLAVIAEAAYEGQLQNPISKVGGRQAAAIQRYVQRQKELREAKLEEKKQHDEQNRL